MTWQRQYQYPNGLDPALAADSDYLEVEAWEGMDVSPPVTKNSMHVESTPRRYEATLPNGVKHVRLAYNNPGQFDDGLVFSYETYAADSHLLLQSKIDWEIGDFESARPRRVERVDELNQITATGFKYDQRYNRVAEQLEFDYGGVALVRRTRTEYNVPTSYSDRHIFDLPTAFEVYQGYDTSPQSRTEFEYDSFALQDAPNVYGHSMAYNPFASREWVERVCERDCDLGRRPPCVWVCEGGYWKTEYQPRTAFRGNLTRITRYVDPANHQGPIAEERHYDITGNAVLKAGPCCVSEQLEYTAETQYAFPSTYIVGSGDPSTKAQLVTQASYDLSTGLQRTLTQPDGNTRRFGYDPRSHRVREEWWPNTPGKNHVVNIYLDGGSTVEQFVQDHNVNKVLSHRIVRTNGLGLPFRIEAQADDGRWDFVELKYDELGLLWKRTAPFRQGEQEFWDERRYDGLSRLILTHDADGGESRTFYNEVTRPLGASTAPGQTTRTKDQWGNERWSRSNALGLLQEVVEPNRDDPSGSVMSAGSTATYFNYDALGNLVQTVQPPRSQTRDFKYDGLSRLTQQYLSERLGPLNDQVYIDRLGLAGVTFTYTIRIRILRPISTLVELRQSTTTTTIRSIGCNQFDMTRRHLETPRIGSNRPQTCNFTIFSRETSNSCKRSQLSG
jgi:YD repeat-containing protein